MNINGYPFAEEIILEGHIIDSLILPKVFGTVMSLGGNFDVQEIRVGRSKTDTSFARLRIFADTAEQMDLILSALGEHGAELISSSDAQVEPAPADGALPDGFYSTTNYPTQIRRHGRWIDVENPEMDLATVLDPETERAYNCPMAEVRKGDLVVVGHEGIRVQPLERERDQELFSFMRSAVSSERPNSLAIARIAETMRQVREQGDKIAFVVGPAIIHSGAGPYLEALINHGYMQVLLGGNAIAVHDVESQLLGTSLGINLKDGLPVPGGHSHHMRAVNAIRRVGGLRQAVESSLLKSGVMHACIVHNVEMVLAGSVRDDGPMPDVITDMIEVQRCMRKAIQGVEMVVMIATMLHSIAVGNMLPAHVKVVVVDINPATVTKLADRGSFQAVGLVTDAELFLRQLVDRLDLPV